MASLPFEEDPRDRAARDALNLPSIFLIISASFGIAGAFLCACVGVLQSFGVALLHGRHDETDTVGGQVAGLVQRLGESGRDVIVVPGGDGDG